jgi:periplasmic protein TonB
MFSQTFVDGAGRNNSPYTILLSFAIQSVLASILTIVPLIYFDALPIAKLSAMFVAPRPPAPPPPERTKATRAMKVQIRRIAMEQLMAPRAVPAAIRMIVEEGEPVPIGGIPGGGLGNIPLSGALGDMIGNFPAAPPPSQPPAPKPRAAAPPLRVGGKVQQANLLVHPQPVYPSLARAARVQGVVRLEARISKEGRIEDLRLVGGPPLLVHAAMQAVAQWVYKPTLLNGEPVEVLTTIDVNFTLGN